MSSTRRWSGVGSAVVIVFAAQLFAQSHAIACDCARASSIDQAVIDTSDIFFGKVKTFQEMESGEWIAEVEVAREYKGGVKAGETVEVTTGMNAEACGVDFRPRRSYLIFASRKDGELITTTCDYTERMKRAPIAPQVRSLRPSPVGEGSVIERTSRASNVFVGQVVVASKGFAGSFQDARMEVKVTTSYKGVKRGKKIALRFDEEACSGKKRSLLDDADLGPGDADAPFERGKKYLFYTYGEDLASVTPCHGNFALASDASDQLSQLKKLCKGKTCQRLGEGYKEAARIRSKLRDVSRERARAAINRCAKSVPMYTADGAITKVDLAIRVTEKGDASLVNISTEGSFSDGAVYDGAVECISNTLPSWEMPEFTGEAVEILLEMRMADGKRAPKYLRQDVELR